MLGWIGFFALGYTAKEIKNSWPKPASDTSNIPQDYQAYKTRVICNYDCQQVRNGMCRRNIVLIDANGSCKDRLQSFDKSV